MRTPSADRGLAKELAWAGSFVVAAIVLTWPIAASLGKPTSIRGDYFGNLWNAWWMRTALFERHVSPYWTDLLHWPIGISLARHTLSPVNALAGAVLSYALGPVEVFNVLVIAQYALGGWGAFLLARELTGSTRGALLAGLLYTFCPFHYFYFAQLNVASIGFLPMALLWFFRAYRDGGRKNVVMTVVLSVLLVASAEYYVVYAYLIAALLAVLGKLYDRSVPFVVGARRLLVAGACGGVAVSIVAWPLLSATLSGGASDEGGEGSVEGLEPGRANDLLGYNWIGPPERLVASWPTMLGYSTLVLMILGWRGVLRQRFLLVVLLVFLILGFGSRLSVGGEITGVPMPYALLGKLPVLSMLRKADRTFVVIQLVVAVLAAAAWQRVEGRIGPRLRTPAWALCGLAFCLELRGAPFRTYDYALSPLLERVASMPDVHALVHLPPFPGLWLEGRYNYAQVVHEKPMPQGYTTNLALTPEHVGRAAVWRQADTALRGGDPRPLIELLDGDGIDLVLLHKTVPLPRGPLIEKGAIVWKPFWLVRGRLVTSRQTGELVDGPVPPEITARKRAALTRALGEPIFEDSRLAVFRRAR